MHRGYTTNSATPIKTRDSFRTGSVRINSENSRRSHLHISLRTTTMPIAETPRKEDRIKAGLTIR